MDIPTTTKAAILRKIGEPLDVCGIQLPETLDAGQVLVKVHYSGVCGSQLGEIAGVKGEDHYLPHLLGHEASGTIISVGPGVRHVKPDDLVVLHWRKGLGIDAVPAKYSCDGEQINSGQITTFSEYTVVSENRLTPIPKNTDLKIAALFGCAVTTGFGVILNNAKLKIGESVVVFGAGGVGLSIIQAASMVSGYPIIAVDRYPERLRLAREMGATHCIDASEQNPVNEIQRIIGENKLDCFIDNTGSPEIIEMGYQITHPQGRVILVGVPKYEDNISIYSLPLHFDKVLTGSHGGECQPEIDIPRYFSLYQAKKLKLNRLITNEFPLTQINSAITKLKEGKIAGRCVIVME